jgi:hypothetical protein
LVKVQTDQVVLLEAMVELEVLALAVVLVAAVLATITLELRQKDKAAMVVVAENLYQGLQALAVLVVIM